jgi:hypothetical protein
VVTGLFGSHHPVLDRLARGRSHWSEVVRRLLEGDIIVGFCRRDRFKPAKGPPSAGLNI